jgi:hypothetical protein
MHADLQGITGSISETPLGSLNTSLTAAFKRDW